MQTLRLGLLALLSALFVLVGCGGSSSSDNNNPPAGNAWTVGSAGGTFEALSGRVRLVVPAGAVAANQTITYGELSAVTPPAGHSYVAGTGITFSHVDFASNATLTLSFPSGTTTAGLALFRRADSSSAWTPVAATIDPVARTATASVAGFSDYGLFLPTAVPQGAYWIEQRSTPGSNSVLLDTFAVLEGGSPSLLFSPATVQGTTHLYRDTFRWSDKTFLAREPKDGGLFLSVYEVEANRLTSIHQIPSEAGESFTNLEARRNRGAASVTTVAMALSTRNATAGVAKDRLLRFRSGGFDVLRSYDRADSAPPATLRPWDVSEDGDVLALTPEGLTLFGAGGERLLAPVDEGASDAYFSPSGDKVLYAKRIGADASWKVYDLMTGTATAIAGTTSLELVRWGSDDGHVIVVTREATVKVERVSLVDATRTTLAQFTATGNFLGDAGAR